MPRRRGDEAVDARGDIEILDPIAEADLLEGEVIEAAPSGSSSALGVLAAVVAGLAIAVGVVTAGNSPAPEPPSPSVTALPTPEEQAALDREAEIAELEATYGVQIGDGPGLEWQQVIWNIGTTSFRWVDDGFVGHDGATEWTIRPSEIGPTVRQRSSLEVDYPGYELFLLDGARVLAPQEASDHVLVVVGDAPPVEFELPPSALETETDLVVTDRWYAGAAIDRALILSTYETLQFDWVALGQRTGRDLSDVVFAESGAGQIHPFAVRANDVRSLDPIVFADEALTEAEISDLTRAVSYEGNETLLTLDLADGTTEPVPLEIEFVTQPVFRIDQGVGVAWGEADGSGWFSTSSDGEVWSTTPLRVEGELSASRAALYRFPWNELDLGRSNDAGRTWQNSRKPLRNALEHAVVDDVLFVTDEVFLSTDTVASEVEIPLDDERYRLILADGDFELTERATGAIVPSSSTMSPSGLAYVSRVGPGLTLTDPATGDELISVPQGAITQALMEDQRAPVPSLAVTRWERSQLDPEWHIEPLDQIFPNAVGLELIPGDGHVLAVVNTPTGTDLYVAATNPGP